MVAAALHAIVPKSASACTGSHIGLFARHSQQHVMVVVVVVVVSDLCRGGQPGAERLLLLL